MPDKPYSNQDKSQHSAAERPARAVLRRPESTRSPAAPAPSERPARGGAPYRGDAPRGGGSSRSDGPRGGGYARNDGPRGPRSDGPPRGDGARGGFAPRGDAPRGGFAPRGDAPRGAYGSRDSGPRSAPYPRDGAPRDRDFSRGDAPRGGFGNRDSGPRSAPYPRDGAPRDRDFSRGDAPRGGFGNRDSGPRSAPYPRDGAPRDRDFSRGDAPRGSFDNRDSGPRSAPYPRDGAPRGRDFPRDGAPRDRDFSRGDAPRSFGSRDSGAGEQRGPRSNDSRSGGFRGNDRGAPASRGGSGAAGSFVPGGQRPRGNTWSSGDRTDHIPVRRPPPEGARTGRADRGFAGRPAGGERPASAVRAPVEVRPERNPLAQRSDVPSEGMRLNKRMAELGMCSRREADDWVEMGWVRVNGEVAEMGQQVLPSDRIEVDKQATGIQDQQVTILLHKPMGYVSGQAEDGHTPAVTLINPRTHWREDPSTNRFSPPQLRGLAPCGRLDIDSVGLLVMTQDGRVARQIIGEDSTMDKEYLVRVQYGDVALNVQSVFPAEELARLCHGLALDGQALQPAKVEWQNPEQLRFVLTEGKKRQIRRMCELVGLRVVGLKRIRIGKITLGQLPVGEWRYLLPHEQF